MDHDLSGKTALITGATSGLGRHFAKLLSAAGARVAVTGRRLDRLESLKKEIAQSGGTCAALELDVTDAKQIPALFDAAEAALGAVNLLINNAGVNVQGRAAEQSIADFDAVMNTNLRGAWAMATEFARRAIARKSGGSIVNIASIGSFRVLPGLTAYCVSKAALAMMTQCLAREWVRHNIRVNAICPGYIETELNSDWFKSEKGRAQVQGFPAKRLMQESDLDGLLLLLAGDAGSAINGALLTVDDAQSL